MSDPKPHQTTEVIDFREALKAKWRPRVQRLLDGAWNDAQRATAVEKIVHWLTEPEHVES